MKSFSIVTMLLALTSMTVNAQTETIDCSGDNTASNYVSYNTPISLPAGKTVNVKMARYCYFSSTITGSGLLNLYAGGERCYLGTSKGATWPDWTGYSGDIHIYPFKANSSAAGFYGVVLAHGGKSFSPENVADAIRSGKVNPSMQSNRVTLHSGATICCEANNAGAGFRIGELQMEAGSTLQGYMKNSRAGYYLLGCLNTDGVLAGTIAPTSYRDDTPLGIIKEGKGTYRITGNDNYLSGSLRVMEGTVLVMNNRAEAESKKMRGALGARSNDSEAIAYVFEGAVLGGTGSIGGTVDNYGTIEPGDNAPGLLTMKNYVTTSKNAHLVMHPASKLCFKIGSAEQYDQLQVGGLLKYSNITQDFNTSDKMPVVQIVLDGQPQLQVGAEFRLLTAKGKSGDEWNFVLQQPAHHTWQLSEVEENGAYSLVLRLTSLEDSGGSDNPGGEDDPDIPESTIGPFYDDGVDDLADKTSLRTYAKKNDKLIGMALSTWKTDVTNENLAETKEVWNQFGLLAAENEMKMETLQPNRGEFSYGAADNLVSYAQRHKMSVRGHCLVWHMQQPQWVSSDGKKNDRNWTRAEALAIMKNHIDNVMQHFKGKILEWDVVNECLDDDQSIIRSNPEGYTLRPTVWQRAIGDDYIDSAFAYARRADPDVLLYLNDYDVEQQGKAKAVAFANLVKHLQQRNTPIDGVGLQCHFSIGDVDSVKLARTFQVFGEKGLKCVITELDMGIPSLTEENLTEQARLYRVITDVMLNNENCPYMVVWGLKDNDSWRSASSPLLYNADLTKKKAWYAVRSALRHRTLASQQTGVHTMKRTENSSSSTIYDLCGRPVVGGVLAPGLYIRDGKKALMGN